MRLLFIQDNAINESLALMELSSYLKANGHQTGLLIEQEEARLFSQIEAFGPDHVLLPASILAHNWFLRMCGSLKRRFPEKKIILAGTHPTFYPDIIEFPAIDIVCLGEAEEPVLELCNALDQGRSPSDIRNLWVKEDGQIHKNPLRDLLEDLDRIPLPDRGLYYDRYAGARNFHWKKFMSGRGCFHSCAYCYQPVFRGMYRNRGRYVRRKSPARVVEEIRFVRERYPIRVAHFSDDLFITDVAWLDAFERLYRREPVLPFSCNSSVEFINDEAVRSLARAGCRSVAIGIETGVEEQRFRILNKRIRNRDILRAAALIKRAGIRLVTFNMMANPGETLEDALETLKINMQIKADYARVNFCFPIPETRIVAYSKQEGLLAPSYGNNIYGFKDLGESPARPFLPVAAPGRIMNLHSFFNWAVRFPALYPLVRRIIRLPANPLFRLAGLIHLYLEKKTAGLSWWNCYQYYRHVGSPDKRTTNFVPFV